MKTLVLGASEKPERYSNKAIKMLRRYQHEVVAIGNKVGTVEGVEIHKGMVDFKDIHTITLYMNPKNQIPYYDYILNLQPKRVIFNPGTENLELQSLLQRNNIAFEDACTLVLLSTDQYER
ncbi:CoA-binding protein [Capnocytophaga sp. ARDL2]|uniref:CoA-binding protein n=1 Tax=Capnocytophaga sp. ARDL2 TaxID=3238809 RepID=UPI0035582FCC